MSAVRPVIFSGRFAVCVCVSLLGCLWQKQGRLPGSQLRDRAPAAHLNGLSLTTSAGPGPVC